MGSGEVIREERLKKLGVLRKAGMDPYPARVPRTASIADFVGSFAKHEEEGDAVSLAGRILSLREHGSIFFVDLFDGTGRVQVVFQKGVLPDASLALFKEAVDESDFVSVTGTAFTTKRGEKSLKASSWVMAAKSLMPVPKEWYGLKDEEARYRQRYLDLLLDESARETVKRRSRFWNVIREFLLARGFIEVETPVLELEPGGAEARPFATHHNALDVDLYLRISTGELWQKRLLVAGFPKVFEIGRVFRNEGISHEHLQDYTQLECYEAYKDYREGMVFVKELYRAVAKEVYGTASFSIRGHRIDFAKEWETIEFAEAMRKHFGIDPLSSSERDARKAAESAGLEIERGAHKARIIDQLWKQVRKTVSGPAFLLNVPAYLEPLAKRSAKDPEIVERFQVIIAGSEVGKGFSELNDPVDQEKRFTEQQRLREAGDEEAQRMDRAYVKALEYGMPPAFGFGVSERLFSFLENKNVRESQLFPLLKPKQEE